MHAQHDVEQEIKTLRLSVFLYIFVFALKVGAYFVTGVMALLAEGLHTLSDIFVSGFLLIALRWSRKAPDQVHMFGYGRTQYVAAIVAATLFISFTSFELYRESIPRLFKHDGEPPTNVAVALGVLVFSMLLALVPLVSLLRQKTRGAAARAQLMELINDQLGLLAALVGTLFVQRGVAIADPLASIVVATIIGVNGALLFKENLSALVGRSPGSNVLEKMKAIAASVEGVLRVHKLRAQLIGPGMVQGEMHVEVAHGIPIEKADLVAREVTRRVRDETECRDLLVHVDPLGHMPGGPERT
ncbi:MAG: cation diffusion facilitator family transporter [Myxococcales bacterium]